MDTMNDLLFALIIIFALSQGHISYGLGVSHVFVHEDITWDLTVLLQDVFIHVSYPLCFGYAHTARSASVSLL